MDRTRPRALLVALALIVLVAVLFAATWWWPEPSAQAEPEPDPLAASALDSRLLAVEQAVSALARGQSRNEQRLNDVEARGKVLRDELLGLGQRTALLDDTVQQVAKAPQGSQAVPLRLDEVDLLLSYAETRLALAGDVDGARRAYALADGLLSALTAPQYVNLRQSLAQEQAALAALPPDPRSAARAAVDAAERAAHDLPMLAPPAPPPAEAGRFQRFVDALVDVRPIDAQDLLAPADRQRGDAALRLEWSLARLAVERRDADGLAAASVRARAWMQRLYAPGEALDAALSKAVALGQLPLVQDVPALGTTLAQLRAQRRVGAAP